MSQAFMLLFSNDDTGAKLKQWSSLIGIVTAIIGNILISFALNIQRYAHIRLDREQWQGNRDWKGAHAKHGYESSGSQHSMTAEESARLHLTRIQRDEEISDGVYSSAEANGCQENQQPSSREDSIHSQSSSDSTIKPFERASTPINKKSYLRSPYWWAGIILMTVGEAGNFLAYGFASASIVSPLGVVALISNCIIAPCLLKERFRTRDGLGVLVAVAGAVIIVLSAKDSEIKLGPDDVWGAITRWEFELYLGITALLMAVLIWSSDNYGDRTILIDLGLVALFGGYTALSTKGVASLLSDTLWRALTFPITYLLIFILVLTALMQIRYVNRALQRFDSTQVIPVQFVLFTISVIVGSAVLYRDFESATTGRLLKFIFGCLLTFSGVYLITSKRRTKDDGEDEGDLGDEENAIGLLDEERYQDEIETEPEDRIKRRTSQGPTLDIRGSLEPRRPKKPASPGDISPRTQYQMRSHASSTSSGVGIAPPSMLENPWRSSEDPSPSARPQPVESSISSPLLPSESHPLGSSTPDQGNTYSTPSRPSTLSRRSLARIKPGPWTSPLSSSFSVIVADEKRRSIDSPPSERRHRLSAVRNSRSQRTTNDSLGEGPTGLSPLKASQLPEHAIETERPSIHSQSSSFTARLGEFLHKSSKGGPNSSGQGEQER